MYSYSFDQLSLNSTTELSLDTLNHFEASLYNAIASLQSLVNDPLFAQKMELVYGTGINFSSLQADWLVGNFITKIEVRSSAELGGANGAYAGATDTIYLSKELLDSGNQNFITSVLLEEYGHYIDDQYNLYDTQGDEGEYFSAIVTGQTLTNTELERIQNEDDRISVFLDGQQVQLEMNTLLLEDFEDTTLTYTPIPADSLGDIANSDYYGRVSTSQLPAGVSYSNVQGSGFYAVQDMDAATVSATTVTLNWTGINIANFTNLNLSWFVAEDDADDGNQDWDDNDSFRIEVQINGGGFSQIFGVEGSSNTSNQTPRVDTNFDGIGDGTEITNTFTQFNSAIANGSILDIRVTFDSLNQADEDIAFDNLLLTGDVADIAPSIVSFVRQTPTNTITNADSLTFRATFSEDVQNVDASDFTANGTSATVTNVVTVNASTYDITLSGGNLANLNGIVGLNLAGGQNIQDLGGNALSTGEPAIDETYVIDNTAPSIISFTRQNPTNNPTDADTLLFRVTFSEDVENVDITDFVANGTTGSPTSITVISGSVYDVRVSGGNLEGLNGTVGLDLAVSQNIVDLAGNVLPNAEPATDETFILDNTASPTTILLEDFEDATLTYTPTPVDSLGSIANNNYYGRIFPPTALPTNISYNNIQGSGFYAVQDMDGATNPSTTVTLNWTGINIANFTNLNLSWFVAEDDDGANQDWDDTDSFRIEIQIDGGGFIPIFAVEGSGGANATPRVDTNFDGVGDGTEITNTFTQFNSAIANGSTLDIRVTFEGLDAQDEDIAFDELKLVGDPAIVDVNLSVSANTGSEAGTTVITVTATADFAVIGDQTVDLTVTGTGITVSDYLLSNTTITILDGQTQGSVTFTIQDDLLVEETETVTLSISNPSSGITLGATTSDEIDILDNDSATVSISATNDGNEAGAIAGVFTVTQSAVSSTDTVISYSVTGTATSDSDFTPLSGTVTILAGDTTATITVPVIDDAIVEANETVVVTMNTITSGDTDISIDTANNSDAIEILDNDSAIVSISGTTNGEETNTVGGVFTVTQSAVSSTDTVISYSVTGTATSDSDFTPLSGTVTILAGDTTATITVPVINDAIVEADETVVVSINTITSGDTDISIDGTNNSDAIEILDNDSATVSISATNDGNEAGAVTGVFTVTQSAVSSTDTVISYSVTGTATSDSDFTPLSGTVTILAGDTTATITVPVINDAIVEADETVVVSINTITSGDTDISIDGTNNSDAIEILDNDSATVSISATNDGNEAGAVTGVFTVTQSAVSSTDTVISYSVTGTATSDSDFTPLSGTVTILAGDTTATITVPVINDAIVEADETVVVTMNTITSGDTDISIDTANNSDAIEILNDDTANLTIANVSQNEGTGGTTTSFNFSVTLEQDVQGGFDIAYNTNEGSATFANNDFIDNDGTLSFAGNAGEVQTITVLVNHDGFDESNETFTVSLGALSSIGVDPANILILGSPATGTIINDDNTPIPDAGGPYVIDEGSDLTLDATGSSDLDGDILTFRWDVDGDGDFDENITGATPTVTWNELVALGIDNGPYSGTIIVEVSDGFNTDTDTTTLNVLNVAPEANDDDFIMELNEANGDERDVRITGNLFLDNGNGIDFDINDAIEVVEGSRTINTTYGIVFIEANGDFIYTPTNPPDIVNTENNTFTDSFIYTIQDSDGATDTATVEITVVDLGIQTNTDTDTLNNGQGIIIELSTENETANSELNGQPNNDTTFVRGLIIPEIKILYAIDISESSLELIDTNGDGIKDITRLEAEIQAMKEFTQYLSAKSEILSRTNVTISVVTYSDGTFDVANTDDIVRETVEEFVIDPTSNSLLIVQNYLDDILELGAERINPWVSLLSAYGLDPSDFGITTDGLSNPDAALDEAVSFFSGDTTSAKLMLFAGAGTPNVSGDDDGEGIAGEFLWRKNYNSRALQFDTELDFLDDVEIIGVNFGNSGYLDEIDSDSSAETYDSLLGIIEDLEAQDPQDVFPIVGSQLTDFKLILNGQFDNDGDLIIGTGTDVNDILGAVIADPSGDGAISIDDVKRTPLGYSFDGIIIGGLDGSSGADNYLTAVAFFDDGTVDVTNNIIGYTPVTNGLT